MVPSGWPRGQILWYTEVTFHFRRRGGRRAGGGGWVVRVGWQKEGPLLEGCGKKRAAAEMTIRINETGQIDKTKQKSRIKFQNYFQNFQKKTKKSFRIKA